MATPEGSGEQRQKLWPYCTEEPPSREECPQCHRRIKLDEKGRFYRHATRSRVTQADFMADRPKQECPASETRPDNW